MRHRLSRTAERPRAGPLEGLSPEAGPRRAAVRISCGSSTDRRNDGVLRDAPLPEARADGRARSRVQTAVLNPLEGLTDERDRGRERYLSVMRADLAALRGALDVAEGLRARPDLVRLSGGDARVGRGAAPVVRARPLGSPDRPGGTRRCCGSCSGWSPPRQAESQSLRRADRAAEPESTASAICPSVHASSARRP